MGRRMTGEEQTAPMVIGHLSMVQMKALSVEERSLNLCTTLGEKKGKLTSINR